MHPTELYQKLPHGIQTALLNAYALSIHFHRFGRPLRAALNQISESQHWPRARLRSYQDSRLRAVIRSAYERSAYYREIMQERGLLPDDLRTVDDLGKLPLLDKATIRARGGDIRTRAKPSRGWLHGHTSGTTGSPLSVWYDRKTAVLTNAVDRRQKAWGGMVPGDWIGVFLGRMIVAPNRVVPPFWQSNRVQRQVWFSSFHLSEESLPIYVEEIRRRGLRFLEGYPSTLYILGRHLLERSQKLQMTSVFTSSETLHSVQEEVIEAAFGCPIHDYYGAAERVIFAGECEVHEGKHLAEEYGITEVVDDDGMPLPPGEPGWLVGTSLHNEAMPLIRYRTSDISAILEEPCPCGRRSIRIADVATKAEDIVITPEGKMISPSVLTHPFKPFDDLEMSQVIQDRMDHVRIRLVSRGTFGAEREADLVSRLQERLGPSMQIEVEYCDGIPREPSGKFRWVISQVDHACRFDWSDSGSQGVSR